MATLDQDGEAVVVRIVYDGPPTSGKTTSLKALAERFGQAPVNTPEEVGGRTLYFDWMEYTGGRFEGRQIRCQIISAPGQRQLAPRRELLLDSADAVVFVADTSRSGMAQSLAHLDDLMARVSEPAREVPVGVVLQANKRDVPDAAPLDTLRGRYALAVVESVASAGDGVREAFVFAVRLALDRVREQMRKGALDIIEPEQDPAGVLLAQMRALPLPDNAEPLWPSSHAEHAAHGQEDDRAPRSARPSGPPRLPDDEVASGCVWPPVQGRILLQEAALGSAPKLLDLGNGNWMADSHEGWRFYSSASNVFPDVDAARAALVRWAHGHALASDWLSPDRCLALCEAGDGTFRLWQVVRSEKSLWTLLCEAIASRDEARVREATQRCGEAAERWAGAPADLPCTLESVGCRAGEPVFVGLMPEAGERAAAGVQNRHLRLSLQAEALVKSELGASAG